MTFYDYDLYFPPGATSETYLLRVHGGHRLPNGYFCRIKRDGTRWVSPTSSSMR